MASLKAAVRSSLSKEDCRETKIDYKRFTGPQQQVSGIQIVGEEIYVSYLGNSVRKFNFKVSGMNGSQISCNVIW